MLHREQPDVIQQNTVQGVSQFRDFTAERVLIPAQGARRVSRPQMDVMEPQIVGVFHQLDPSPPGVEDESILE